MDLYFRKQGVIGKVVGKGNEQEGRNNEDYNLKQQQGGLLFPEKVQELVLGVK